MFWLYILQCADKSLYIGNSDNLELRVAQHAAGTFRDCYTFGRRPLQLIYAQEFPTRDEALGRERQIKGWSRAKKLALVRGDWNEVSRLAKLKVHS